MYIVLFIHLLLAQFLPAQAALQPLNTEGVCSLSADNNQDGGVRYYSDIFAENTDDSETDDNEEVSNPLEHTYYLPNLPSISQTGCQTKPIAVLFDTPSFPKQKLFLLYNQLKLDC